MIHLHIRSPSYVFVVVYGIDSPIKLTKRWRKNHEEDQLQQAEVVTVAADTKRPNILDLTFGASACTNTSIVNWLNQTTNIALETPDYSPVSSSLSSPTSISSSNTDDEPFNYLYLLASAAVDRLSNSSNSNSNDQVPNNLELTIKT